MGWSSGAELADEIWEKVEPFIPSESRPAIAEDFIKMFERYDCDCMRETTLWSTARSRLEVSRPSDNILTITISKDWACDLRNFAASLDKAAVQMILDLEEINEASETYDLMYKLFFGLDDALRRKPNV